MTSPTIDSDVVVDASMWVSRFYRDDAYHHTCRAWFRLHQRTDYGLIAPTLLLPELAGPIARPTGAPYLSPIHAADGGNLREGSRNALGARLTVAVGEGRQGVEVAIHARLPGGARR
ncbi:MAG: hypothetical protein ACRDI2_15085 [Chloroflexota bacterium]